MTLTEQAIRIIVLFVTTPLMVEKLGEENYGVWLVAIAIIGYLRFFDLGVSFSGTRFLGRALGSEDEEEYDKVIEKLSYLFSRIGLCVLISSIILSAIVPLVASTDSPLSQSRYLLFGLGTTTAIRFWTQIFEVQLKSHVRYDLIALASICKTIVQGGLVIACLLAGFGLIALLIVFVFSDLINQLLLITFSKQVDSRTKFLFPRRRPDGIASLIRYSVYAMITNVGTTLRNGIDPLVVGAFSGLATVPVYSIGARFLTIFTDAINALFGGNFLAAFSQMDGRNDREQLIASFKRSVRLSASIATLGGSILMMVGPSFIERWMGTDFFQSGKILLILTPPTVLMLAQYPIWGFFFSQNKQHWLAVLTLCGGGLNLVLSIYLAGIYGVYGVILATAIELFTVFGLIVPYLVARVCEFTVFHYLLILIRSSTPIIAVVLPLYLLTGSFLAPSYFCIGIYSIILMGASLPPLWFFSLHASDRSALREVLNR